MGLDEDNARVILKMAINGQVSLDARVFDGGRLGGGRGGVGCNDVVV